MAENEGKLRRIRVAATLMELLGGARFATDEATVALELLEVSDGGRTGEALIVFARTQIDMFLGPGGRLAMHIKKESINHNMNHISPCKHERDSNGGRAIAAAHGMEAACQYDPLDGILRPICTCTIDDEKEEDDEEEEEEDQSVKMGRMSWSRLFFCCF